MGGITEVATSAPGNSSLRPNTKAPLAETLRLNGYCTAQLGKCHEVPVWQTSPMGPFDMWPTGSGFEYFYGFIGGEDNQWNPALYEGTTPVEPPATPEEGYHLTEDLADKAIAWVGQQKALMPDKPFFMYFAPGATHAPHHVPKEWIEKYRGKFDDGWDRAARAHLRPPEGARRDPAGLRAHAAARGDPAWDDMPDELKPVLARQMEVYAGFLEHTDHHVGRLIDAIEELGALDDTLVYVIIGDNGASAEGTLNGAFNEMANFNGMAALETTEFLRLAPWTSSARRRPTTTSGGLGARDGHPLPVDEAGGLPLGRDAQRHDRPLARRHRGQGRGAQPVLPRDRRVPDRARGGRAARPGDGQRRPASRRSRARQHGLQLRRRQGSPSATTSSTSRCSPTAASTTRAGAR